MSEACRRHKVPSDGAPLSACIIALGCPKNLVDSEHLAGTLAGAGFELVSAPNDADLAIVTTCAFLRASVAESEQAALRLLRLKRRRPGMKVVVAGCLVQRFGKSLREHLPGVDLFAGIDQMTLIPNLLARGRKVAVSARPSGLASHKCPRLISTPRHYAYLKIADGCDNRCSYCLIPRLRGRLRSRAPADILAEARSLVRSGVKELIIVGQDTTAYGADIGFRPGLPGLLRRLGRLDSVRWLRLMYTHPSHITDDLLRELETNPKLCRYIDMPIQHVSARVLSAMNRPYGRKDVESLLARLRSIPGMRIRTTVIVGFPGETHTEFGELLGFIRRAEFDRLGCYPYSPEPGTAAAALKRQVPGQTRQERARQLMRVQAAISRRRLRALLGRTIEAVVDAPGLARTEWDAPEIDGVVRLVGRHPRPGSFTRVRITDTSTHDIVGVQKRVTK